VDNGARKEIILFGYQRWGPPTRPEESTAAVAVMYITYPPAVHQPPDITIPAASAGFRCVVARTLQRAHKLTL
jgi:hypothetical protein